MTQEMIKEIASGDSFDIEADKDTHIDQILFEQMKALVNKDLDLYKHLKEGGSTKQFEFMMANQMAKFDSDLLKTPMLDTGRHASILPNNTKQKNLTTQQAEQIQIQNMVKFDDTMKLLLAHCQKVLNVPYAGQEQLDDFVKKSVLSQDATPSPILKYFNQVMG